MRAILCSLLAGLLLGACGFRLIGSGEFPPELSRVHIETALGYRVTEPPVATALAAKLARRGAQVLPRAESGAVVLRLYNLEERRETLSIGPDGKVLEYRLVIGVRYQLLRDGTVLVPEGSLAVSRDYSFQLDQILQKELEEEQLRAYIQNELAELVLLRLETGLSARNVPADLPQVVPATS